MRLRALTGLVAATVLAAGLVSASPTSAVADDESGPTGTFTGRVLDAAGRPVEGAWVRATSFTNPAPDMTGFAQTQAVETDADGVYTLTAPVGYDVLSFGKQDYEQRQHDESDNIFSASRLRLDPGAVMTVDAVLRRPQPRWTGSFQLDVGTAQSKALGRVLDAGAGEWVTDGSSIPASELTISYQWYRSTYVKKTRSTTPIPGAVGPTYKTSTADLKKHVSVRMTARHPDLRDGVSEPETSDPVRRLARITGLSARSPKKNRIDLKIKVSAEGLTYASGKVKAQCYRDRKAAGGTGVSKRATLSKGRATTSLTLKGAKKGGTVYCFTFYDGASDTRNAMDPISTGATLNPRKYKLK